MTSADSPPWISVVVTTYDGSRYDDFEECVNSVLNQSYERFDVVVVTETDEVRDFVKRDFGGNECVEHVHIEDASNLATARNTGAVAATGDVVAFIDDDCVADSEWLSELARGYQESGYEAVGGRADPNWPDEGHPYIPEEFYWLVGATHRGFAEGEGEVRNTFGCNISFRRETFLDIGGFDPSLGKDHGHNLQGEETDLCARMRSERGAGVYYVPDALVEHKVYPEQTEFRWLVDRAFWQGVTKAIMSDRPEDVAEEERGFLGYLATQAVPTYTKRAIGLDCSAAVNLVALMVFTCAVGVGFVYGNVARYL